MLNGEAANVSHIAMVHSETTSGVINDLDSIGELATKYGKSFVVDSSHGFGAIPIDFYACGIDYLCSTASQCIEGVAGLSFVIARKTKLQRECHNNSSSLVLDLYAQRASFDLNGQFAFTPPTQAVVALHTALAELKQEGGVSARAHRYTANQQVVQQGFASLGFSTYVKSDLQGPIVTSFRAPTDKNWNFATFSQKLIARGFGVYPAAAGRVPSFRISHAGRIFESDCAALVRAVDAVCAEMKTAKYAK